MNKELEEVIERLNRFSHITVLYSNTFAMTVQSLEELQQDIETLVQAVKNSIPKEVIEEKIEDYKNLIDECRKDEEHYGEIPIYEHDIKVLQELLQEKGEK